MMQIAVSQKPTTAVSPRCDHFTDTDRKTANIAQEHPQALPDKAELHHYIVIPAYQPDERLVTLVRDLHRESRNALEIVVIDDGSDASCRQVFETLGGEAIVLQHPVNRGKGAALKTAFSYIREQHTNGIVVTADADGQHTPEDILRVGADVGDHPKEMVLGKRTFTGNIPWKSRVGNHMTRKIFTWCSGHEIWDTQTGLRGFSTEYLSFLQRISGDRYEYEMNMLYEWVRAYPVRELPIQTIYLNENESSHFCPLKDGWRIYRNLLTYSLRKKLISFYKFCGVSLLSFGIDYVIYSACAAWLPLAGSIKLIAANTIARGISGLFNFEMNRRVVFQKEGNVLQSGVKYLLLAICIYLLSTTLISGIYTLTHFNVYILKLFVDFCLFLISWAVQKHFVF